jgi:hypothetical protein
MVAAVASNLEHNVLVATILKLPVPFIITLSFVIILSSSTLYNIYIYIYIYSWDGAFK